jgi:hypothetical protein
MVREILMALQGNKNIVLIWTDRGFTVSSPASDIDDVH